MRVLSLREGKRLSTAHSVDKWWCQGLSSKPEVFSRKCITFIFVHFNEDRDYRHAQYCCIVKGVIRNSEEGMWSVTWGGLTRIWTEVDWFVLRSKEWGGWVRKEGAAYLQGTSLAPASWSGLEGYTWRCSLVPSPCNWAAPQGWRSPKDRWEARLISPCPECSQKHLRVCCPPWPYSRWAQGEQSFWVSESIGSLFLRGTSSGVCDLCQRVNNY